MLIFATNHLYIRQLLVSALLSIVVITFQNPGIDYYILMLSYVLKRMSHCTLKIIDLIVFDCCANILYHLDNIRLYLDTYSNILNGIAILDRRFLDMEMLEHFRENLISYLNNARCCKTLTVEDLNVMSGILSRSLDLMIEGLINNQTDSGRQKDLLRQAGEDDKIHSKLVNML